MVPVSQAHMMADPESVGDAGVSFVEDLASNGSKVVIPMITDPRGVDLAHYQPLGQTEEMATLERRFIAACEAIGIMMTQLAPATAASVLPITDITIINPVKHAATQAMLSPRCDRLPTRTPSAKTPNVSNAVTIATPASQHASALPASS